MEARDYLLTSFIFIWNAASRYDNEAAWCMCVKTINPPPTHHYTGRLKLS